VSEAAVAEDCATADDIAACFRLLLGRAPSAEEFAAHGALAGQPLAAVVQHYLDSPEHARRVRRGGAPEAALQLTQKEGFAVYTDDGDLAVGRHVAGGAYQPEIAALFRAHLRPGMVAIDVGANIGYFTMLAASLVGPSGQVLAVEPNPANLRMIEASRRANGFAQVSIAGCAIGRELGLLALETGYSNGTTAAPADGLAALFEARLVPSLPLSRLLPAEQIDFIKLDAEGAEYAALADVAERLRQDRPVIVSEFSPTLLATSSGVPGEAYLQLLSSLGYGIAVVRPEGLTPCADGAAVMAIYHRNPPHPLDLLLTPAPRRRRFWGA
jgi:FkbM family methyltransferase